MFYIFCKFGRSTPFFWQFENEKKKAESLTPKSAVESASFDFASIESFFDMIALYLKYSNQFYVSTVVLEVGVKLTISNTTGEFARTSDPLGILMVKLPTPVPPGT